MKNLNYKYIWLTIGVFYVLSIIYFCLIPSLGGVSTVANFDKIIHFSSYALCSFWFLQILSKHLTLKIFIGVFLLGTFIELAQGLTVTRYFEFGDILANTLGNLIGLAFSRKVCPQILQRIDAWIFYQLGR